MNFATHCQVTPLTGILPPRKAETQLLRVETSREAIDARCDAINERERQERQRNLDALHEEILEGKIVHHRFRDWKGEGQP